MIDRESEIADVSRQINELLWKLTSTVAALNEILEGHDHA